MSITTSSLSSFTLAAATTLLGCLINSTLSIPVPQDDGSTDNSNDSSDDFLIEGSAIPVGIVLCVVGVVILLFGARLWRLAIVIAGGSFFAWIAWIILINIEPASGWETHLIIYWVTLGVAFVIGALLSWCMYQLGVFILGCIAGVNVFFLTSAIIGLDSLVDAWLRYLILAVVAIALGILAVKFEPYAARIGTATVGAASLVLGIDVFVNTGLWQNVQQAVQSGTFETVRDASTIALIVSFFLLAIIGSLIQFKKTAPMDRKL